MINDPSNQLAREAATEHALPDNATANVYSDFETWLETLKPRQALRKQSLQLDDHKPDFFVVCTAGSNCRISFEGVLHIEGFVSADIHSESGTLITGEGLIDGEIRVGAAFIDSSVIGNIHASERVVLYSEAKVAGNIIARALSTKAGALIEGDCLIEESVNRTLLPLNSEAAPELSDKFQV